jgi:ABC-type glutathione transport system ATPase component
MTALLSVKDLSVHTGELTLIDKVSFEVDAGERVGLIGESGSGKSLTALAVLGLLGQGLHATAKISSAPPSAASVSYAASGSR